MVGLLTMFCSAGVLAKPVGQFAEHLDIGAVKHSGSAIYDAVDQKYTISGSGKNMWAGEDQLQYVYNQISGDFIVSAQVAFEGKGVDPHRKIGWNVRSSLDTASPNINTAIHGDGLTSLQFRESQVAILINIPCK